MYYSFGVIGDRKVVMAKITFKSLNFLDNSANGKAIC